MILEFLKGFWGYVYSLAEWWQGAIIICVIVFIMVVGKFWRNVISWIGYRLFNGSNNGKSETLQYRMFWGLSNDAINILMKNEIRRSMKENGFCEWSGNEFAQYVKNQSKILLSILRNHFINLYPSDDKRLQISMENILDYLEKQMPYIEDLIFEIYIEAKTLKTQDLEVLEEIDKKFEKEIDTFIKKKNGEE